MSRVEWTRLEGADVEAVVAMLVNREHPRSVRITPSIGDGGVDILNPRHRDEGCDDVYQVKKYTEPLTSRQKTEVENSLSSLTSDERWGHLRLGTWYLVTPWDPTPEAYGWLRKLADEYDVDAVWHGLTHVEQMVAKYPDVVDYYLHGGASRITEAYRAVIALNPVDGDGTDLEVLEAVGRIEAALPTLETDPHYRYELRFGSGQPAIAPERPGLVMTTIVGRSDGGRWAAVDVIARCAASTEVRPIRITGQFIVDPADPFIDELRGFQEFGAPFSSPEGAYVGEIDAPGGLGGRVDPATVRSFASTDDLGENPELHFEVLDPEGAVLAAVDVVRVERSRGTVGVRVVLEEVNGFFAVEDRYNLRDRTGSRNIRFGGFAGAAVATAHEAVTFLTNCRAPNVGRVSMRHAPPELGRLDPNVGFDWPDDAARYLGALLPALEDLLIIQRHTSNVVRVPDEFTARQVAEWRFVARVLEGQEGVRTYPDGHALVLELAHDFPDLPCEGSVTVTVPLAVRVGSESHNLGDVGVVLENPTLLQQIQQEDGVICTVETPGRVVRYQRLTECERFRLT